MALRQALLFALLTVSLTSGCLDDEGGSFGASNLDGIPSGTAPAGEGAGTPGSHGNSERSDSQVTVSRQGSDYVAKKTVTFVNDFGGAANADVKLTTRAGGVEFQAWDEGGYEVVATLTSRAATEAQARQRLDLLKVLHNDRLGAGRLSLETTVQFPNDSNGLSGGLEASLPQSPAYRLTGTTDAGGAYARNLGGPSVSLTADAGGVGVSGAFNAATLTTDAGGVELDGIFNVVTASADAGGISARIQPTASGTIELSGDAGGIELMLDLGEGRGYDVEADVDAGGVSISLGDTDAVGSQTNNHKHVRTAGYEDATIQVGVTLSVDAGGIDVGAF